jgi:peptidoglycan hydrolase-like protein with peptidoglycan-binding domain
VGYRNLLINGKYIRGYGLPDFEGGSTKLETVQPSPAVTTQASGVTIKLTQLAKGSKGAEVKSMQTLLIRKFSISCGTSGADGDFGNGTQTALKTFQRRKGLTADGICGRDTWSALLAG